MRNSTITICPCCNARLLSDQSYLVYKMLPGNSTEIAQKTGCDRSSIHRIMMTLLAGRIIKKQRRDSEDRCVQNYEPVKNIQVFLNSMNQKTVYNEKKRNYSKK